MNLHLKTDFLKAIYFCRKLKYVLHNIKKLGKGPYLKRMKAFYKKTKKNKT